MKMARHIVAVCVVCLLCADRIPCEQHFDNSFANNFGISPILISSSSSEQYFQNHGDIKNEENLRMNGKKSLDKPLTGIYNKRRKRHAGHSHDHEHEHNDEHTHNQHYHEEYSFISEKFLQRIFNEYGQEDGTIHFKDFRRMLKRLGLTNFIQDDEAAAAAAMQEKQPTAIPPASDDSSIESSNKDNKTCTNDYTLIETLRKSEDALHDEAKHQCKLAKGQVNESRLSFNSNKSAHDAYNLKPQDFLNICPVLLYQLSSSKQDDRAGCINPHQLSFFECSDFLDDDTTMDPLYDDTVYKWSYAFTSVLACSVLGLVGVAIIPFMDTRFYKHIIQFFVALAVGTMTGDALLHLLPHSLAGQSETNMIFKGLTCMGGIVFFYITEHGLTMISEWRRRIEKQEQKPSRAKIMHDADSTIHHAQAGEKLCKSKYSSYPYCYDEIALAIKKDEKNQSSSQGALDYPINCSKRNSKVEPDCSDATGATQSLLANPIADISHNAYLHNNHSHGHQHHHSHCTQHVVHDNNIATDIDGNAIGDAISILPNGGGAGGDNKELKPSNLENKLNETVTVILREHESTHHGHSHKHGHVHSPPTSLTAVAWMIIMGDGLHNFTDGMAIGAAFAENIAGGFSTSFAVFCHELPHELGDFAILIKAGMTVRSAVYYNLMTGILSFIGMLFGLIFGQSQDAAQWMFAAAAGLFIYIALVDMLPELSTPHKSVKQLVLQILGMLSGVFIMLLIAIYEGDLMTIFDKVH